MTEKVKRESSLDATSHFFYRVYFSKHNKESIVTLRDVWSLDEFFEHKEQIEIIEAYETAISSFHINQIKRK